jgi:hypothetical protein
MGTFQRNRDGRLPFPARWRLVEFDYEPAEQDSFRFVATRVRKL